MRTSKQSGEAQTPSSSSPRASTRPHIPEDQLALALSAEMGSGASNLFFLKELVKLGWKAGYEMEEMYKEEARVAKAAHKAVWPTYKELVMEMLRD